MPIMINTKDIGRMGKDVVKEFMNIQMGIYTKVNGKMILNMVMEC